MWIMPLHLLVNQKPDDDDDGSISDNCIRFDSRSVVRALNLCWYQQGSTPSEGVGAFSAMFYSYCGFHVLINKF